MPKLNAAAGAGVALLILALAPAAAQDSRTPSVEEIVRKLMQPKLSPDDLKNNAVQIEGRRQRAEAPAPGPSIDLTVNFEYASARLSADARIVLDNLGAALAEPALSSSRFRIAGHTDARGGDAYNLALSKMRARSVADYLARQHHINAKRLSVEGFGRSQLLDPANPESAVNRRVQVINLGS
jgi:outer membrane protein OmpA-like peptidoglycan-associated protein